MENFFDPETGEYADGFSEFDVEKPVASKKERAMKGLRPLGAGCSDRLKRIAPKYGFVAPDIIMNWEAICGKEIARMAKPLRITFPKGKREGGVIVVKLNLASAAAILQYSFPQIIDRVNAYFGYKAVSGVRIDVK